MSYVALYRKYRPYKLSDVVGQTTNVELLKNIIENKKISHAYIFSGPRGTGKTSIAKIFARSVNCENPVDGDICEECEMCKKMLDNNLDIIEIDAASNNGVDEIREIRENSKLVPSALKYKIYIIDEAHMLSTSAFNALLKTLEEPPKHVIFILATTEINKIPLTVLSRCMRLDFKKIDDTSLLNRLKYILEKENRKLPKDVLQEIVRLSNGGLRDAINYLDQSISIENITVDKLYDLTGEISEEDIKQLFDFLLKNDVGNILKKINYFSESSKNYVLISEKMLIYIRDVLIYQSMPDYFEIEYKNDLKHFSDLDSDILYEISKILISLSSELKKTNNQKLTFEIYMIMITEIINKTRKKSVDENKSNDIKEDKSNQEVTAINQDINQNIDYINKNIRINNTFVSASKELLNEYQTKYIMLNDYLFDKNYNNISKFLISGQLVLASSNSIVIKFTNENYINMLYLNINEVTNLLAKILGKKLLIAAVNENEWNNLKKEYIENKKSNNKYVEMEEIKLKNFGNKDKIELVAENLFGEENIEIK